MLEFSNKCGIYNKRHPGCRRILADANILGKKAEEIQLQKRIGGHHYTAIEGNSSKNSSTIEFPSSEQAHIPSHSSTNNLSYGACATLPIAQPMPFSTAIALPFPVYYPSAGFTYYPPGLPVSNNLQPHELANQQQQFQNSKTLQLQSMMSNPETQPEIFPKDYASDAVQPFDLSSNCCFTTNSTTNSQSHHHDIDVQNKIVNLGAAKHDDDDNLKMSELGYLPRNEQGVESDCYSSSFFGNTKQPYDRPLSNVFGYHDNDFCDSSIDNVFSSNDHSSADDEDE